MWVIDCNAVTLQADYGILATNITKLHLKINFFGRSYYLEIIFYWTNGQNGWKLANDQQLFAALYYTQLSMHSELLECYSLANNTSVFITLATFPSAVFIQSHYIAFLFLPP